MTSMALATLRRTKYTALVHRGGHRAHRLRAVEQLAREAG